jgi:hypothetical protein
VAIGMRSPGPVVITATLFGYLVAGSGGHSCPPLDLSAVLSPRPHSRPDPDAPPREPRTSRAS